VSFSKLVCQTVGDQFFLFRHKLDLFAKLLELLKHLQEFAKFHLACVFPTFKKRSLTVWHHLPNPHLIYMGNPEKETKLCYALLPFENLH
jgi:hypothetical protein